jgi:hypothetical protein
LGSKKNRQFWDTFSEIPGEKRNTREGMKTKMILEQVLEGNPELVETFHRLWTVYV